MAEIDCFERMNIHHANANVYFYVCPVFATFLLFLSDLGTLLIIYSPTYLLPRPTQPSILPGSVNEDAFRLGSKRAAGTSMVHSVSG